MNAPPNNDPEAKPTRAVKMRFKNASFIPMKMMPMKAIRLTAVTEARITIKLAIYFVLRSELFRSCHFVWCRVLK